ncbi:TetR/AcrR family transcriptional regulator [Methylibium sp. Pch-M]|nr:MULTISPECIES: TetR/AcrR family transcriptional regulator [Methylibium]EWS54195.1 putative HTH-type transcriptional regulator YfiR [Methylibium sp. T29]MBN9204775.1 TetR/AcrR family transcriptional regulator [Methylibium petroleiphilum]QAZ40431.1 TetR/AcrR family transcriptional regulator [Methylibium sp. Pch-M]
MARCSLIDGEEVAHAEVRRRQILDAAVEVFRRRGFHAASMAEIAKTFGMSAGHIYNYFDSKEAIIEAIVARDIDEFLTLTAQMQGEADLRHEMVERVDEGTDRRLDADHASLQIEIVAEASRNPKIADMVRRADATVRRRLIELVRAAARGPVDEADLVARAELLLALFEGLMLRTLRQPDIDRQALKRGLRDAVRHMIGA